jgi:UDP-4-amino-4,6-dideoxy-N-acetyl-beta-L-altrosamine N-acetyltransferase
MYSQREIMWEEHLLWFQRMQADARKHWYLYLNQENEPSGVVYFIESNFDHAIAFWGFYANPNAIPGTGIRMSLDALDCGFNELGIQKLNAEVLASSQRSLQMHKKVGFIQEGCFRQQYFNGETRLDVIRFGMLASEWPQKRLSLEARIMELDLHISQHHK